MNYGDDGAKILVMMIEVIEGNLGGGRGQWCWGEARVVENSFCFVCSCCCFFFYHIITKSGKSPCIKVNVVVCHQDSEMATITSLSHLSLIWESHGLVLHCGKLKPSS